MAKGRMLKKEISESKKLGALESDSARLLYTWLIPWLDIEGRYTADPDILKGHLFPKVKSMTVEKIELLLFELAEGKLIYLYKSNGEQYLQFVKFKELQSLHPERESKSDIPSPKDKSCELMINQDLSPQVKLKEANLNEVKVNEEEYPLEFQSFWEKYPNKKQKQDAYDAWKELNKTEKAEVEIAAVNYSIECVNNKEELKYIKHGSSFCRKKKKRWKDYLVPIEPIRKVGESRLPEKTPEKKKEDGEYMIARAKKERELKVKYGYKEIFIRCVKSRNRTELDEIKDKIRNDLAKWHEGYKEGG